MDDLARSASAVAREEIHFLSLDQAHFRKAIERSPAMAFELMSMLSRRIRAVEKALIVTLGRFLPICAHCKKIRMSGGEWIPVEVYIGDHSDTEFSHGICPECVEKYWRLPNVEPP